MLLSFLDCRRAGASLGSSVSSRIAGEPGGTDSIIAGEFRKGWLRGATYRVA
jgi:hypothetical protein